MSLDSKKEYIQVKEDLLSYIKKGKRALPVKELQSRPPLEEELSALPVKTPLSHTDIKTNVTKALVEPTIVQQEESLSNDPLAQYRFKVTKCMKCSLSQGRKNVVFGNGNINSMLYIVGEAPGRDEDLTGQPFVGRSGQLLTKMLEAIAIQREDIFITNIVKCRPPENRDPLHEEIESCTPYLMWQLEYGKPKYILTLGRFSTGYFLNDFKSSLTSLRGVHDWSHNQSIKIVPTFHPAAVLRSPNKWKPVVWDDLKKLAFLLVESNFYSQEQLKILKKNKVI